MSATGEVTAIAVGSATITATTTNGNKTATCVVTVGDTKPSYMFYGAKNKKMAFFDGTELKIVEGANNFVTRAAFMMGQDYCAVIMSGIIDPAPQFVKTKY